MSAKSPIRVITIAIALRVKLNFNPIARVQYHVMLLLLEHINCIKNHFIKHKNMQSVIF